MVRVSYSLDDLAFQLAEKAQVSATINNIPPKEIPLMLIANFEGHKEEFSADEQEKMKKIIISAIEMLRDYCNDQIL